MGSELLFLHSFILYHISGLDAIVQNIDRVPENQYCSFFNNRAPSAQPGLKNCTWFRSNSCCQQQEIEATFGRVKPLKGASTRCQLYTNYLMCYICTPWQNVFYQNEQLTVCQSFCDELYDACKTATMKGDPISKLYHDGEAFCRGRRFIVSPKNSECFTFDLQLDTTSAGSNRVPSPIVTYVLAIVMSGLMLSLKSITGPGNNGGIQFSIQLRSIAKVERYLYNYVTTFLNSPLCKVMMVAVILLFGAHTAVSESPQIAHSADVRRWSSYLSEGLVNFADDVVGHEVVHHSYETAKFDSVTLDGMAKVFDLRDKIGQLINSTKLLTATTAKNISSIYSEFSRNSHNINKSDEMHSLLELTPEMYIDSDNMHRIHLPDGAVTFNSMYGMELLLNRSVVKIPHAIDLGNRAIINTVKWSSEIDKIFRVNLKVPSRNFRWQYFASEDGVFRVNPGLSWKRGATGGAADYEPRVQSWYYGHHFHARDIIIIIDTSISMARRDSARDLLLKQFKLCQVSGTNGCGQFFNLARARKISRMLVGMLTEQQYVSVIASASLGYDSNGKNASSAARVLGCQGDRLYPATAQRKRELYGAIADIHDAVGGSDHRQAFRMAYDMLRDHRAGSANCGAVILFVTDGKPGDDDLRCDPGTETFTEDNRHKKKPGFLCHYHYGHLDKVVNLMQQHSNITAPVFSFIVSPDGLTGQKIAKRLACDHGGEAVLVAHDENIYGQMAPFFDYIHKTNVAANRSFDQTMVSGPLTSQIDNSLVVIVSTPVIAAVSSNESKYLGVAGVEIAVSKLEELFRNTLPIGTHAFLINLADGTAIVHHNIKQSFQLMGSSRFVSILDLELTDKKLMQFLSVMVSLSARETGELEITGSSRRAVKHNGILHWQPTKSAHYYYATVPGTHFGVVLVVYNSETKYLQYRYSPRDSTGMEYLHTLMTLRSSNQLDVMSAINDLNVTIENRIPVSFQQAAVAFGPQAFCKLAYYFEQYGTAEDIEKLQKSLNTHHAGVVASDECRLTAAARADVFLTHNVQSFWTKRNHSLLNVSSRFVATPHGVWRTFPGQVIRRIEHPDPTRESWYTAAVLNRGLVTVNPVLATHTASTERVELSKTVEAGNVCSYTGGYPICSEPSTVAVVGANLFTDVWNQMINTALLLNSSGRAACGQTYPCSNNPERTCRTACQLLTDAVEQVTPSRSNVLSNMSSTFIGCFLEELLHARVILKKSALAFQSNCWPEGSEDWKVNRNYDCVENRTFYTVNRNLLDSFDGLYSSNRHHKLYPEREHVSGSFYFVPINSTNLFLLVVKDFNEDAHKCPKLNRTVTCSCPTCATAEVTRSLHKLYRYQSRMCYEPLGDNLPCQADSVISSTAALVTGLIVLVVCRFVY